ncbi:hypothetical protein L210DRAFT_941839 [Boletus edulis BED1]|uniref:Uncharacterized protein n=1 Tax=Boletus edulis BED1 TaxID=1328754 RepID=A0AAD4C9V0_BOLED|nr:hypothetical protein L210DRAFT_949277 [Boletus edulis BED1]KAF8452384.1 hypothetical protein L210DRAFT_941839 [Boletus edulis BED1]
MTTRTTTCYPSDSDQLLVSQCIGEAMCEPDENEIRPDEVLRLLGRARYIRFIINSSSRYLYG